jgi:hypothetical protein
VLHRAQDAHGCELAAAGVVRGHCRKQFSVLTNTIFHGTKISIRKWIFVLFEVAASKNSVSAWEISRKYSITNESAWHMLHRIRESMKMEPVAGLLGDWMQDQCIV